MHQFSALWDATKRLPSTRTRGMRAEVTFEGAPPGQIGGVYPPLKPVYPLYICVYPGTHGPTTPRIVAKRVGVVGGDWDLGPLPAVTTTSSYARPTYRMNISRRLAPRGT